MHMRKPIIGIPADRRLLNSHWFHCVGEKYINAIVQAADAVPVLVPALGERYLREWIASFDGILFTGSPSNVEPQRYRGPKSAPGTLHDPERDATTLPLIRMAVSVGLPVFAICRDRGASPRISLSPAAGITPGDLCPCSRSCLWRSL